MEQLISHMKDPSGDEFYLYEENGIKEYDSFIYEVSLHKYWKNGYCLLGIKLYKSNKFIPTKTSNSPNLKSLIIFILSKAFVSECR